MVTQCIHSRETKDSSVLRKEREGLRWRERRERVLREGPMEGRRGTGKEGGPIVFLVSQKKNLARN